MKLSRHWQHMCISCGRRRAEADTGQGTKRVQKCDFSICHIDDCLISHFCHLFLGYTNKHCGRRRALLVRSGSVVCFSLLSKSTLRWYDSRTSVSVLGFLGLEPHCLVPCFVRVRCPLSELESARSDRDRHNIAP